MKKKLLALLLVGAAAAMSTTSWAADPSTLRVVAVQTNDLAAYTKALGEIKSILARLDPKLADPEFGGKMAALGSLRKVLSDSLYRELKL
jgi:hypothetical protein